MTDNVNATENENQVTADTAQAEGNTAAAGLGKFKSVDALMSAYLSLEAEFTRRSQRLKELEEGSKARSLPQSADGKTRKVRKTKRPLKARKTARRSFCRRRLPTAACARR